ncbi:MAG: helical backbone metal receptor [Chloroflexota bacterium]
MRTQTVTDQMDRSVTIPFPPQRIVSLVPSQTELLFDLGLGEQVVGVTKFCVHPAEQVRQKQSVGGTKKFRFDVIEQLQPDLILGNKEENYEEGIERLVASYPVWMSDVKTLNDGLEIIRAVGEMTGCSEQASELARQIEAGFGALAHNLVPSQKPIRTAYFIWQKPYMVVGGDTFIDDMLARCGFENVFREWNGRYPQLTPADIEAANLDLILLSSEPFPFAAKHQQAIATEFPNVHVELVDGELFSWYGSRLLKTAPYLTNLASEAYSFSE